MPDDLATICYTSGTTGNPKGVMLTHENIVADVGATLLQLGDQKPNCSDVMISFLPLAHMLERICEIAVYMNGGGVGFFTGDVRNLMDDMKALQPTITPAVPRLLNRYVDVRFKSFLQSSNIISLCDRIFDKVQSGLNGSSLKRFLFNAAINSKEGELRRGIIRNNTIWDKLVLRKVQESMGGRIRLLVVGSAPLAGSVLTFMRCALGCVIVEGYGQTECVAPTTLTVQVIFVHCCAESRSNFNFCCQLSGRFNSRARRTSHSLLRHQASRRARNGVLRCVWTRRDLHQRHQRL